MRRLRDSSVDGSTREIDLCSSSGPWRGNVRVVLGMDGAMASSSSYMGEPSEIDDDLSSSSFGVGAWSSIVSGAFELALRVA